MSLSWSARSPMPPKTTEMTFSCRFLLIAETMPFISVLSTWDLQILNQQELFSIPVRSISLSPLFFAMMRLPATTSSKSTTHCPEASFKETKPTRDARPWLTTCTSLTPIKSFLRPHQSSLTDPLSFKVSYGRITLASSHLKPPKSRLQSSSKLT